MGGHENNSVCVCVRVCVCKKEKQCVCVCVWEKWLLFGLAPCPLVQKTVKSEMKRFTIVKQFSPMRLPLL